MSASGTPRRTTTDSPSVGRRSAAPTSRAVSPRRKARSFHGQRTGQWLAQGGHYASCRTPRAIPLQFQLRHQQICPQLPRRCGRRRCRREPQRWRPRHPLHLSHQLPYPPGRHLPSRRNVQPWYRPSSHRHGQRFHRRQAQRVAYPPRWHRLPLSQHRQLPRLSSQPHCSQRTCRLTSRQRPPPRYRQGSQVTHRRAARRKCQLKRQLQSTVQRHSLLQRRHHQAGHQQPHRVTCQLWGRRTHL
mmetsp:Transcript_33490/g.87917  ORF Transcript_33490/g.87917 Transcript_33490/m.87917 type:complete len:244 (-) Transcript_33490:933-1664(-)